MVKIKEIMSRNPVTVEAHKTVREAIHLMAEKKLECLLVCNRNQIVGILEETHMIKNVLAKDLNPLVTAVIDVMSAPFVIDGDSYESEAGRMMHQHHVRHLAVSIGSKIAGVISMFDLIRPVSARNSFIA